MTRTCTRAVSTRPSRRVALAALVALVAACSDGGGPNPTPDAGTADAGADAAMPTAPEAPASPVDPELPALEPCPVGWRVAISDTVTTCDPAPTDVTCVGDTGLFPGETDCVRIGTDCPDADDPWATDLPADRVIRFVRADAEGGGDGSRDAPFDTIAGALADADPDDVVALSTGTFDEIARVPDGVTLWGACVAETILTATTPNTQDDGVVTVRRAATIRNLTITGPRPGIRVASRLGAVEIEDVRIDGAAFAGILAGDDGATVTGRNVVIRDTRSRIRDGIFGRALDVEDGARLDLTRVVLEGSRDVAVFASDAGGSVTLTDFAIRDVQGLADGSLGRGLVAGLGVHVTLVRGVVERTNDAGLFAADPGTLLTLDDVVVRDIDSEASTLLFGDALDIIANARAEVRRAVFERCRETAVYLTGGGDVLLDDVVIRQVASRELDRTFGRGLGLEAASAVGHRVWIEDTRDVGLLAGLPDTLLEIEDLGVVRTAARENDDTYGRGISIQDGVSAQLARVVVADNRETGVGISGSVVHIEDLVVRDTQPQQSDGGFGRGLGAEGGSTVEIARALLSGNQDAALSARSEGTTLTIEDLVVQDTEGSDGLHGRGISLQEGARATVTRASVERNREIGVFVAQAGTSLALFDVEVLDTLPRTCEGPGCDVFAAGIGVGSYDEAATELTRFVVSRAALTALQLARGGTVDLHDGLVSDSPVGANVQTDGFDLSRLSDRVVYRDNGRNLDASALPVPGSAVP